MKRRGVNYSLWFASFGLFFMLGQFCYVVYSREHSPKALEILYRRNQDLLRNHNYASPDNGYQVRHTVGDGEVATISVHRLNHNRLGKSLDEQSYGRKSVDFQRSFVQGYSWVPRRPHSLIFAVSSDNNGETPGIFLWEGNKRVRLIKHVKNLREEIQLIGVTRDGKYIIYDYWPDLMSRNSKRFGPFVKSMRLPMTR